MNGVEPGGFGAILIVAQAVNVQNRTDAQMLW
jgi:hypothetical protein